MYCGTAVLAVLKHMWIPSVVPEGGLRYATQPIDRIGDFCTPQTGDG